MMANIKNVIIFPKDHHSAFRMCKSPFFRTVQFFCLGFQSTRRFLLFLTILLNDGPELQQSHWAFNYLPSEAEWNLARISPFCSGGDPDRCLLLMQSAQLHWLTEQAPSKFCRRIPTEKLVGFRASQNHCEFGNGFKQQLEVKLPAWDTCHDWSGFQSIVDPHSLGSTLHRNTHRRSTCQDPHRQRVSARPRVFSWMTQHTKQATISYLILTVQTHTNHDQVEIIKKTWKSDSMTPLSHKQTKIQVLPINLIHPDIFL